jgi:hypothetical protein
MTSKATHLDEFQGIRLRKRIAVTGVWKDRLTTGNIVEL